MAYIWRPVADGDFFPSDIEEDIYGLSKRYDVCEVVFYQANIYYRQWVFEVVGHWCFCVVV